MPCRRAFGASARSSHEGSGKSRVWFAKGTGRSAGALLVIIMEDGWSPVHAEPGTTVLRNEDWVGIPTLVAGCPEKISSVRL